MTDPFLSDSGSTHVGAALVSVWARATVSEFAARVVILGAFHAGLTGSALHVASGADRRSDSTAPGLRQHVTERSHALRPEAAAADRTTGRTIFAAALALRRRNDEAKHLFEVARYL